MLALFFFFFFFFFNTWPLLCGGMFLLIPSLLRVFIMKVLYFVKFFYIYWEDHVIFIFSVIIWFMYLLEYFEPFLYLRDNSYFFIAFNPFKVFTNYSFTCWKFFVPVFRKGWYSVHSHHPWRLVGRNVDTLWSERMVSLAIDLPTSRWGDVREWWAYLPTKFWGKCERKMKLGKEVGGHIILSHLLPVR